MSHVIAQVIRKCKLSLKLFGATVIAWPFSFQQFCFEFGRFRVSKRRCGFLAAANRSPVFFVRRAGPSENEKKLQMRKRCWKWTNIQIRQLVVYSCAMCKRSAKDFVFMRNLILFQTKICNTHSKASFHTKDNDTIFIIFLQHRRTPHSVPM